MKNGMGGETVMFTNSVMLVYTNSSGELFVENTMNGVTIRVSDRGNGLTVTSLDNNIRPTSVNGLDAFKVTKD